MFELDIIDSEEYADHLSNIMLGSGIQGDPKLLGEDLEEPLFQHYQKIVDKSVLPPETKVSQCEAGKKLQKEAVGGVTKLGFNS